MSVTRYMSFVWRVIILQPGARVQTAPALKRNQRDTQSRLERAPTNTVQFMSSLCPTKRDTNEIKQADLFLVQAEEKEAKECFVASQTLHRTST